jgi:hypothetical protein
MTREELCAKKDEAVAAFSFTGTYLDAMPYGSGHINDTFLARFAQEDGSVRPYILQRMNHEVFRHPEELIENIRRVTGFLRERLEAAGKNADRECMNLVPCKDGGWFYRDSIGSYWRAYLFIDHAVSLDAVTDPSQFYQSAVAFGRFQQQLDGFDASTLHEVIPHFHDTPDRYRLFEEAVAADKLGRAAEVADEIAFVRAREAFTHTLMDAHASGKLPLRVTHNDTKLNNIMLDETDQTPVCVIDLDTVMPGFSVNDFGDSIRFGANTAAEDEQDCSKVHLDLNLFALYTKGFLEGCGGKLTDTERALLPVGAKMMTLECGMRFLTDYLEGDTYFRTKYPTHNLVRCRTQFALVREMEAHWDEMCQIVESAH